MPLLWKWMEEHADEAGVDKRQRGEDPVAGDEDPLGGV